MTKANKYIGKKASQTLYYASEMANKIQLPLNQCITINFSETTIAPLEIIKVFYKLKAKLKLWIETTTKYHKAFTFTAAWVFENCINGKGYHHFDSNHNIHVHWAIHIPRGYEDLILAQIEYYLKQMTVINDRTLHMTDTLRNLTLSYFMKGCHPDYMDLYGREQEASDQGSIPGDRRSGTTRNIAPKARKAMDNRLGINIIILFFWNSIIMLI